MSGRIQFYHLTASPLERALPKLLEKAVSSNQRVVLVAGSKERSEEFNQLLWTYDPGSFLPHGTPEEGDAAQQPVLIAAELETVNMPSIVVVVDGSVVPEPQRFAKVLDLFDGRDDASLQAARTRWVSYKNAGCALSYLQQSPEGAWQEKQAA